MEDKERVPAVYGISVILPKSSAKKLSEQWSVMKELFTNLQFCVDDFGKLQDVVDKVIASSNKNDNNFIVNLVRKDIQHFPQFSIITP